LIGEAVGMGFGGLVLLLTSAVPLVFSLGGVNYIKEGYIEDKNERRWLIDELKNDTRAVA